MWIASEGGVQLTHDYRASLVPLLTMVTVLSIVWQSAAGQGYTTSVYEGQIKSVRIDKCGVQPGLCEGAIIVAREGGEATQVDIRIGTWIKRGENFLTIEDL